MCYHTPASSVLRSLMHISRGDNLFESCIKSRGVSRSTDFFFLMKRGPPKSTLGRSTAASDVYKSRPHRASCGTGPPATGNSPAPRSTARDTFPVSYTHLRAPESVLDLVCRLVLEKKKKNHPFVLPFILPITSLPPS